jgi:hypothetical protein
MQSISITWQIIWFSCLVKYIFCYSARSSMYLYYCLFVWPSVLAELFYSNYFFEWCALYIQMWASSSQASPAAYCLDLVAWFRDGIYFVVFYSFHDLCHSWLRLNLLFVFRLVLSELICGFFLFKFLSESTNFCDSWCSKQLLCIIISCR